MDSIIQKLRHIVGSKADEVRSFFIRNDPNGRGIIQYDQLGALLRQVDQSITDHEIMALARMYCERSEEDKIDSRKLIAIAQEQLRKRNFEGFGKLLEACSQEDKTKYVIKVFVINFCLELSLFIITNHKHMQIYDVGCMFNKVHIIICNI